MPVLVAQTPVTAIAFDYARYPDRDQSQILNHLVRYCAKFDPLPAVTVVVEGDRATVIRGHKYLQAALELGRPTIRAVIASPPGEQAAREFLAHPDVVILDWERIKAEEEKESVPLAWHVFFFERALSPEEKRDFDERVNTLFAATSGGMHVVHDDAGPLAEFQVRTPVTDDAAARAHLATFLAFSRDRTRIVSFQGRKFAFTAGP